MDFTLTPDQHAFRERTRSWLKANIPAEWKAIGSTEVPRPEAYEFLRKWQKNTAYIKKCFDRVPPASLDGKISLRHWIPHDEPDALRLMSFVESELVTTFRKQVAQGEP